MGETEVNKKQSESSNSELLSRLVEESETILTRFSKMCSLYRFRPILNIQCMEIRSPPFINIVNRSHPVVNKLARNEFLVEFDSWVKHL